MIRGDAFNLFNHTQFYNPGDAGGLNRIDSPTFGQVQFAHDPRLFNSSCSISSKRGLPARAYRKLHGKLTACYWRDHPHRSQHEGVKTILLLLVSVSLQSMDLEPQKIRLWIGTIAAPYFLMAVASGKRKLLSSEPLNSRVKTQ